MVTKSKKREAKRRAQAPAGPPVPTKKRKTFRWTKEDIPPPPPPQPEPEIAPAPIPLKLILGERSSSDKDVESLTWTCGGCGKKNPPRRGLIADYPVLQCDCGQESDIEFDFSLGNVMINGQRPVIQDNVKTQSADDCTIAATSASMEITFKMRSILAGEEVEGKEVIIDMNDLRKMYEASLKLSFTKKDNKWDADTIVYLAALAKIFGVKPVEAKGSMLHKVAGSVKVKSNFYDIVRVLADGHPLPTGIITGKKFRNLKPGQIYKAPRQENMVHGKHSFTGHAIVLIGAGRWRHTNYYHFINSWGNVFCVETDRYGFGMIRATDILFEPLKFIRYQQEVDFHKRLASTA